MNNTAVLFSIFHSIYFFLKSTLHVKCCAASCNRSRDLSILINLKKSRTRMPSFNNLHKNLTNRVKLQRNVKFHQITERGCFKICDTHRQTLQKQQISFIYFSEIGSTKFSQFQNLANAERSN